MIGVKGVAAMDWSHCADVERIPGKVSGAWLVKGTRIPADAVVDQARAGLTPEEKAEEVYQGLPVDRARRIIDFARARHGIPRPA
jgi:uncharacterized protein (DUF433 family)